MVLLRREGFIKHQPAGVDVVCSTWYVILGELSNTTHPPLVCLHGGPGLCSEYLSPLEALAGPSRAVILYDQVGCGRSTRLRSTQDDATVWTEDLFLTEISALLLELGLGSDRQYDLLGHSWGGYIAAAWAARRPVGLRKFIAYSPLADIAAWNRNNGVLRDRLPSHHRDAIATFEAESIEALKNDSSPPNRVPQEQYAAASSEFWKKHLCQIEVTPEPLAKALESFTDDLTVQYTLFGPFQFTLTGLAKDWSVVGRLAQIQAPTLVINTKWDKASDITVKPFFEQIQKVKWVRFETGSHFLHFEKPHLFVESVESFLNLMT